jgi:undecaprenyl-phosphate 4-deoxy-4-formamido-L-arabinose transferase
MERRAPSLTVLVPVYNSEGSLRPLVERLEPVLARLASEFELVFVNDSSRDGSWQVIQELARGRPWIRGFSMMRNYGQHNALLCGIRAARGELIVTMDDDLQHPPEEIEKLLAALADEVDVVYGTPHKERHGLLRDLASQITKLALEKSMGAETASQISAFRVFRSSLRAAFANYQSQFVSVDVLLTWGTTRFRAIPVRHDPRTIGVSNYTLRKLLTHAMNMMTGFSTLPLQLASWIGFVFTALGIGLVLFLVIRYLIDGSEGAGLHLPGLAHRDLLRRPAVRAGHHRRVSGAHALPHDGPADLRRARRDRRRADAGRARRAAMISPAPELLEWDSRFFGLRIARLEGRELSAASTVVALDWCRAQRIDCLYLRSDSADALTTRSAAENGFRFVDVRMTLDCDLLELEVPEPHAGIRTARAEDVPALREIAGYNHRNSRFYADGRFERERCDELYATWIERSVEGWADRVIVAAEVGHGPQAYLTLHLRPGARGEIAWWASRAVRRARASAASCSRRRCPWLKSKRMRTACVVTQGCNVAAQRLYQAGGFRTRSLELWHHRWFDRP